MIQISVKSPELVGPPCICINSSTFFESTVAEDLLIMQSSRSSPRNSRSNDMRVYELGKKSLYWKNGWRTRGDSFANFFDGHQPDEEAAAQTFFRC